MSKRTLQVTVQGDGENLKFKLNGNEAEILAFKLIMPLQYPGKDITFEDITEKV